MDIISEPEIIEEHVQDYDFAFPSGGYSVRIHAGDSIIFTDEAIRITLASGEVSTLIRSRLDWYRMTPRTLRTKVPPKPPGSEPPARPPDPVETDETLSPLRIPAPRERPLTGDGQRG